MVAVASACGSEPSPSPAAVTSIVVGGLQVDVIGGPAAATPALDATAAGAVIGGELAAGRARVIGTNAGVPPVHVIDAAFVPALVRIIGPAGGTDFEPPEPVAAWVIVTEGRGADGTYIGVGVVDQDGLPITTYVITPGVG